MPTYSRYAIYWLPEGDLSRWGEGWLGWDMADGRPLPRPAIPGLPQPIEVMTRDATVYGLHATIKPPFRLAEGQDEAGLREAFARCAAGTAPAGAETLALTDLDGFLALTPLGDVTAVGALAARVVEVLDPFRAPAPPEEIERRRRHGLTPAQEAHLLRWGYPYVMDQFRFHVTLTGRLPPEDRAAVAAAILPQVAPLLPRPFRVTALSLVGQTERGFRLIETHRLTGNSAASAVATVA